MFERIFNLLFGKLPREVTLIIFYKPDDDGRWKPNNFLVLSQVLETEEEIKGFWQAVGANEYGSMKKGAQEALYKLGYHLSSEAVMAYRERTDEQGKEWIATRIRQTYHL